MLPGGNSEDVDRRDHRTARAALFGGRATTDDGNSPTSEAGVCGPDRTRARGLQAGGRARRPGTDRGRGLRARAASRTASGAQEDPHQHRRRCATQIGARTAGHLLPRARACSLCPAEGHGVNHAPTTPRRRFHHTRSPRRSRRRGRWNTTSVPAATTAAYALRTTRAWAKLAVLLRRAPMRSGAVRAGGKMLAMARRDQDVSSAIRRCAPSASWARNCCGGLHGVRGLLVQKPV